MSMESLPPVDESIDLSSLRERALGFWYKCKRLWKDHRRIVLGCLLGCTALFFLHALITGPMYISTAKLMAGGQIALPEKTVFQEERVGYFGTQRSILESREVQQSALESVALLHPELKPVHVNFGVKLSDEAAVLILQAEGPEPKYTQAYLASVVNSYQSFKKKMRAQIAEDTSVSIQGELLKLQNEIAAAEAAKVEFQQRHSITFMKEQAESVGLNLIKVKTQLSELTTQYNLLDGADIDSLPPGSEILAGLDTAKEYFQLKAELQNSEVKLVGYKKYMKAANPKLQALQQKVARLQNTITNYRQQSKVSLAAARASLGNQLTNLKAVVAEWEKRALEFSKQMAEFDQLEARLTRAQTLYEKLVSSVQNVDVGQKVANDLLTLLEEATPAKRVPSYYLKRAATGALCGAFLGAAILFVIGLFDNRMSSLEELTSQIKFPVLASIPSLAVVEGARLPLLSKDDDRPIFAEAYRNLRSALLHTKVSGKSPQVLLLTSSVPSEGKTTVSANLGSALSLMGKKVLVIDADLRKGRLHEDFGQEKTPAVGLSDLLSGASASAILEKTPTLHFLPRGAAKEHPSELLQSGRWEKLLSSLRSKYDLILVDTPPLLAAEDAMLLYPSAEALLYVVRAHFTASSQMQAALRLLESRQIKPLGVIFNLLDIEHPNYYHYKYSDYYHRSAKA